MDGESSGCTTFAIGPDVSIKASPEIQLETISIDEWLDIVGQRYPVLARKLMQDEPGIFKYYSWREYWLALRRRDAEENGFAVGRLISGIAGDQFILSRAIDAFRTLASKKQQPQSMVIATLKSDPADIAIAN